LGFSPLPFGQSLATAGELIYNPIAQKVDNTGILADCIHSLK